MKKVQSVNELMPGKDLYLYGAGHLLNDFLDNLTISAYWAGIVDDTGKCSFTEIRGIPVYQITNRPETDNSRGVILSNAQGVEHELLPEKTAFVISESYSEGELARIDNFFSKYGYGYIGIITLLNYVTSDFAERKLLFLPPIVDAGGTYVYPD